MSVIALPALPQRRWTWPGWPAGLYEDNDRYRFDGEDLDRDTLNAAIRAAGEVDASALVSDLVGDGALNLAAPDMAGVVAGLWAADEYAESALTRPRWVELFRANGFSVNGHRVDRPAEPVRLFRSCVPTVLYFDHHRRPVAPGVDGRPLLPSSEIFEAWHSTKGMSWTSDGARARSFARRYREHVFAATVAPEFLLAVIGDTHIVDPAGLLDVASVRLDVAAVKR